MSTGMWQTGDEVEFVYLDVDVFGQSERKVTQGEIVAVFEKRGYLVVKLSNGARLKVLAEQITGKV